MMSKSGFKDEVLIKLIVGVVKNKNTTTTTTNNNNNKHNNNLIIIVTVLQKSYSVYIKY
jgi:hypothetical protein